MRHRHRWPYIIFLSLLLFIPALLASPFPSTRTHRHHQRQLHRLAGGHFRILDSDSSDDSELITASAGDNGKIKKGQKSGEEEKKTLSQQVAEGKYGLIQKELFKKVPKRPGILSYAANSEVPNDNIATLGGLTKSDIWLAENHLLVIRGGTYPPHDDAKDYVGQIWQPIDDFNAPLHQVKIPKNPKIPPPFPVQLTDDGPLQILGTNSSRTLNASAETPAYALPPPPGWDGEIPPQNQFFPQAGSANPDSPDPVAGETPLRGSIPGEPPGGLPFPPALLNGSLPPFFAHLPPGAAILPAPLGNETEPGILDEDDPSIFYPPPYSFYYPKDNSSAVPPGPLVPGIILPPPPKFFAPLEEDFGTTKKPTTTTRKPTQTRPPYTTKQSTPHTTTESPLSNEITTSAPVKTVPTRVSVVKNYSKVTVRVNASRRPTTKLIKTTVATPERLNRTYLPVKPLSNVRQKTPVTILRPVKTEVSTPRNKPINENIKRPTYSQQPKYDRPRIIVNNGFISTTQVPLKYHSSSQDGTNVLPEKFSIGTQPFHPKTTPKPPQPPANYYFYEEHDPALNSISTEPPPLPDNYYAIRTHIKSTTQAAPYSRRPQYIYVTGTPYESQKPRFRYVSPNENRQKPNTFSVHIAKLQNQIQQFYTSPRTVVNKPTPKPVYQYSFEAENYQRPSGGKSFRPSPLMDDSEDSFKPMPQYSVQIQPAIEIIPTSRPNYQQLQPFSVEEPTYFSTERPPPNQQYLQEVPPRQSYRQETPSYTVTAAKPIAEYSFQVTPNPIYQGFYTKPDEGYFDDNTKQYFTIFGRKLPSGTTPIPSVSRPTATPQNSRYKQGHHDRPLSLESDINVNYAQPRPPVNPQSESFGPEIVKAIEIAPSLRQRGNNNKDTRYISYQLPGDEGAHFYFLTPQAAKRRRQENFFYERVKRGQENDNVEEKPH